LPGSNGLAAAGDAVTATPPMASPAAAMIPHARFIPMRGR
jgi:hypothetical protein